MGDSQKSSTLPDTGKFSRNELNLLASSIPANLPSLRGKLIGRNHELQTIRALFLHDDARLVTLAGFGGAGKTTLALHAAHSMLEFFSGGLFFIDLTTINESVLILPSIAKTLGVPEEPKREIADSLRDFLSNRSILFVLDNFEHLMDGVSIVSNFLKVNPHVRVLATSREALRLHGEQVLPVAPLESNDSVQVFAQYAQLLNPNFRLTEDNTPAVTELCKKLDGLPLAIELAAMRTRIFTPQALLARLQSDLEAGSPLLTTLTSGPRDLPERQQTLRGMIAWSYNLLTDDEKKLLQAAAFFRSGFEIQTLAQVTAVPANEAEQIVESLVDKNLIQSSYGSQMRFHLLESIREFAIEQARDAGVWEKLQAKFVSVYRALMQNAANDIETSDGSKSTAWIKSESENLLAALDGALNSEDEEVLASGVYLMEGLEHYWFPYCHYSEAKKYLDLALQRTQERGQDISKAIIYGMKGTLCWSYIDLQGGIKFHQMSAELLEALGDEKRLARALNNLAANLDFANRVEEAESYYIKSLALSRKTGDTWNELRVLSNFGNRKQEVRINLESVNNHLRQALDLAKKLGRNYEFSIIEFNLACLYYLKGDLLISISMLEETIQIADENRYLQVMAFARGLLGRIALDQKKPSLAASLLDKALEFSILSNFQVLSNEIVEVIAELCIFNRRYEEAVILYEYAGRGLSDDTVSRVIPFSDAHKDRYKRARMELGSEKFERSRQKGQLISLTEIYPLAVSMCRPTETKPKSGNAGVQFTERELEVLGLLAQGKTNEDISKELVVVLKTVEKHVANVLRKLGVKNRTEAAAWALEHGIK